MKTTTYFAYRRGLPDRTFITDSWIEYVINNSTKTFIQEDGRIRRWAKIAEAGDRWLRVVLLEDGETVHNAFFDRSFAGIDA